MFITFCQHCVISISNSERFLIALPLFPEVLRAYSSNFVTIIVTSVLKELSLTLTLNKTAAFVFISTGFRKNQIMFDIGSNYILP